ncbi:MAG TPA: CHASE2 domain-containing protein [Fimbriimonadaceae bacterium]|nr:CHASE2 domain-containing protein [Fimbriimonadaceae bacterium]
MLWLAAVSIATIGALGLRTLPAVARWDQSFVEGQRRPLGSTDRIDVIGITNETFRKLGAANDTPGMNRVSTELLPQLIAALERAGASVLAIDLIYETPREDAHDAISLEYRRKNALLRRVLAEHRRLPVVLVLGHSEVTSSGFSPTPTYTWIPSPIDPELPHVRAGQAIAAANVQYVYPVLENPLTGGQIFHIGVLTAARSLDRSWDIATQNDPSATRFAVAGKWRPIDASGLIPIRYPVQSQGFRTTELTEAIAGPERFRGRVVFLGTVGDTEDRHGSDQIDGVYACAAVTATLLERLDPEPPSQSLGWSAVAGFVMAALGGLAARRGSGTDLLVGGLIFLAVAGLIGSVVRTGYPLGPFVPLAAFVLSALMTLATVAVAFTPRAVKEGAPVEEEIEADYLFVDLVGSTRLSGSMDPREYGRLVAEIVTRSSDVVRRHGGEVANTTGDGILAYFRRHKADPIAAIRECQRVLGDLGNVTFTYGLERGRAVLRETRVGDRLDRALSGEAVNRAAKLQDICPDLGIDVAIGPDFARKMKSPGVLREAGTARLSSGAGETPVWTLAP